MILNYNGHASASETVASPLNCVTLVNKHSDCDKIFKQKLKSSSIQARVHSLMMSVKNHYFNTPPQARNQGGGILGDKSTDVNRKFLHFARRFMKKS